MQSSVKLQATST